MANLKSQKIFGLSDLIIFVSVYWTLFQECNTDASWTKFALYPSYPNTRLVIQGNFFQQYFIEKGSSSIWARIDCSHSCANQNSCHAFNFYENENFYVCELLSDNLRRNKTVLQMLAQPGCSVWEKLSTDANSLPTEVSTEPTSKASTVTIESSTDTSTKPSTEPTPKASTAITEASTETSTIPSAMPTTVASTEMSTNPSTISTSKASTAVTVSNTVTSLKPSTQRTSASTRTTTRSSTGTAVRTTTSSTATLCEDVRPGCLGTMPNCHSCIKTCVDFWARDDLYDPQVSLWPDGDGPDSVPIHAECEMDFTILSERVINLINGTEPKNYLMPFNDMRRLIELNVYPLLKFTFRTSNVANSELNALSTMSSYTNASISPNGTLSNLIYVNSVESTGDIFNLQGQPMKPTPFVNVTDDRYGCGSFWLLDTTNATYCPGGALGMFGPLRTNGSRVVNTGMRVPTYPNKLTFYSKIMLVL